MSIRRTLAIAAASIVALSASIAPAQAQTAADIVGGANVVNGIIDNLDCSVLKDTLYISKMATPDSTRSELAATLRASTNLGQIDPVLGLAGNVYAGRIADRALTCGAVKPDPQQDILTQLQNLSSNLSS